MPPAFRPIVSRPQESKERAALALRARAQDGQTDGRTVSNDTRVRAEGFVKIIAKDMPLKGWKLCSLAYSRCLASRASASMFSSSGREKSSKCKKCLPWRGSLMPWALYHSAPLPVGAAGGAEAAAGAATAALGRSDDEEGLVVTLLPCLARAVAGPELLRGREAAADGAAIGLVCKACIGAGAISTSRRGGRGGRARFV